MIDRNGRIRSESTMEKIIGLSRQDFLGKDILDILFSIADKMNLKSGRSEGDYNKPGKISDEHHFTRTRTAYQHQIFTLNDRLAKSGSVIVFRDITERKRLKKLRK